MITIVTMGFFGGTRQFHGDPPGWLTFVVTFQCHRKSKKAIIERGGGTIQVVFISDFRRNPDGRPAGLVRCVAILCTQRVVDRPCIARVYTYTLENNLIISGVIKHGGLLLVFCSMVDCRRVSQFTTTCHRQLRRRLQVFARSGVQGFAAAIDGRVNSNGLTAQLTHIRLPNS